MQKLLNELQAPSEKVRDLIKKLDDVVNKHPNLRDKHLINNVIWELLFTVSPEPEWEKLGGGANGIAFFNKKYQFVAKVFSKDEAFLDWMEFCKANQQNPYVPKIKNVMKLGKYYFWVRMEKLYYVRGNIKIQELLYMIADLEHVGAWSVEEIEEIFEEIKDGNLRDEDRMVISRLKQHQNTLAKDKYLADVISFIGHSGHDLDVNEYNMMQRRDRSPVFLDPLAISF